MKRNIIFGVFALALIAINLVQTFHLEQDGFSLGQLVNVALADGESGGSGDCHTNPTLGGQLFDCGNGNQHGERFGTLVCEGSGAGDCLSGTYYYVYSCDGTISGSDNVKVSSCE